MTHYFLFAGEVSGDLHGSRLMQALKEVPSFFLISGVGGPKMRQEGLKCVIPMEEFQVMGLTDVLKSLPYLLQHFYKVLHTIIKTQPDYVILIDYPEFNLRLARALRKRGFKGKLVQYICPTVWAHGKRRIKILEKYYDLLLTIFPFEAHYFKHTNLKVEYIGHPLVDLVQNYCYQPNWQSSVGIPLHQELIALFPGSRLGEIQRHVPQQLEVAAQLKKSHPNLKFALSYAQEHLKTAVLDLIRKSSLCLNEDLYLVPPQYNYELMATCKTALAKSGTVTLELALHGVPTVVHYELSNLNYLFAKYLLRLRLPYYCIVNILKEQSLFPEVIGRQCNSTQLKNLLEKLHFNSTHYQFVQKGCEQLKQQLQTPPAHYHAVKAIQEL